MTEPAQPFDAGILLAVAARALARGPELDARLDPILAIALADRGASAAMVAGVSEDGTVHALRTAGEAASSAAPASLGDPASDPIAAAIAGRRPVVGGTGEAFPPGPFAALHGLDRVLAVPLVIADDGIDRSVGALAVGWRPGELARDGSPGVLDALADLAAVAVDRQLVAAAAAEWDEWQERVGHLDPLTGLANRRTLDRVLELEIARAARQQSEVSVAVFDVDRFRATNERDGAAAGDGVLRAVAAVLAHQVRLVDTVARIGGDEFVVVAPGSGGVTVADRILRAVEALGSVADRQVSISAGIARFPADGTGADELLAAALTALEGARTAGPGSIAEVGAR